MIVLKEDNLKMIRINYNCGCDYDYYDSCGCDD